jgi:hypothetical protein
MTRNAKSLKKNDEACKGILIAPSKLPRFSRLCEIPPQCFSSHCPEWEVGFGRESRGTDGNRLFVSSIVEFYAR